MVNCTHPLLSTNGLRLHSRPFAPTVSQGIQPFGMAGPTGRRRVVLGHCDFVFM